MAIKLEGTLTCPSTATFSVESNMMMFLDMNEKDPHVWIRERIFGNKVSFHSPTRQKILSKGSHKITIIIEEKSTEF